MPPKIAEAKKTPGKYLCKGSAVFFIEVGTTGRVYQLDPRTLVIDGELSDDGWNDGPATTKMRVFRLEEIQ
jgi:hypothetical protein